MKNKLSKLKIELANSLKDNIIYNTSFIKKDYNCSIVVPKKHKKAAVLCLFDNKNDNLNVILTLRSKKLKNHPGQISFPGGKLNKDETNHDCAIRETYEEIGIKKKNIYTLGELNLYLSGSNFLIKPIVGITEGEYGLFLNKKEVDKVFYFPINFLFERKNLTKSFFKSKSINKTKFYYDIYWQDMRIWGTTALILVHLSRLVKNITLKNV